MNPNQRMAYRNSLPRVSIWDFSSSSDEDIPVKKQKVEEKVNSPEPICEEVSSKEYGPTIKHEIKDVNPKLLEHLGYVNRNNRPPSSKKNEILPSLDTKKIDLGPCFAEKKNREKEKISQIKQLLSSQRK